MKKAILLLCLAASIQFVYAQKSVSTELPNSLYNQGKDMFLGGSYTAAIHKLEEFKLQSKDDKLLQEAEFMILASEYHQGKSGTSQAFKAYLEKYPSTVHRNTISFYIGSLHYAKKEWDMARYWLNQTDIDYLTLDEQEDHTYRSAYSQLQLGNKDDSRYLFSLLSQRSRNYNEQASFYLAYIDFSNGEYAKATPVFQKLKDKGAYKEKASFFLIQSAYLEQNISNVISEGTRYLSTFPNSDNNTEVNRMLGNSYYRSGEIQKSIKHYEDYAVNEKNPMRDDMYQLAEAYYRSGNYGETITTLKRVASSSDVLGQAGNMLLGQSYLKLHDTSNALMAFDAAARSNYSPAISEEALYNYVMLVNEGSNSTFGESVTALQNFLTKYPNSQYTKEVTDHMVSALLSVKDPQIALNAIAKIQTPSSEILKTKQILLYQLGVKQSIDGEYGASIATFNTVINMGNYDLNAKREAYFWRADAAYRMGDYAASIKDYDNYNKLSNSSLNNFPLGFYNLAYSYYQTKEYNSALANFKRYIEVEPSKGAATYTDAMNRIGDCYLFNRNFKQAENYYAQAVGNDPNNADYSEFQKAFVLGLQKNYRGKVTALDAMMQKYPDSHYSDNALFEKSRALVMLNKEGEAITILEQLFKEYPKTNLAPSAGVQLGQLYFNMNKPQQSISAYKQVVENYPNSPEARTAIKSMEGVYKDINDIGAYAGYLRTLGKGNVLSASRQDSLTYLAAENVSMKDNKPSAKAAFNQYLKTYPNGVFASDAHFYLGNMAFEAKDFKTAETNLQKVIKANNIKYMDDALIIVSGIQFDDKKYDAAYKTYEQLSQVASSPENRNVADLGMLRCAFLTDKDNEVIAAADKLMKNSKISQDIANETRFYRGRSHRNLGNSKQAISDLKEVAKNSRSAFGAQSQYLLADIYYQAKEYDKVEAQVLGFMKQGTSYAYWMAKSLIVLADTYEAKGDNFQARQYLESLQANYSGSEKEIKDAIAKRLAKLDKASAQDEGANN